MSAIDPTIWQATIRDSIGEMAAAMGLDVEFSGGGVTDVGPGQGCYISLTSDSNVALVGLCAAAGDCRAITGALLGMDAEDVSELPDEDVLDGVGELVNVLVGLAKTKLEGQDTELRLGLPIFVNGHLHPSTASVEHWVQCELEGRPCQVAIHAAEPVAA